MRVVFAGTPDVALPSLEALVASPHEVVAVVTRPDAPAGRGRSLVASPVAQRAEELGLEVLKPEHPRDEAFQARLRELAPDAVPVVAYGAILPESALAIPRHGWINLHFSLLPAYRGAAPVQHAVWAGEEVVGVSVFRIVPELDAGPVFGVMTQDLTGRETAGELLDALAEGGAHLLVQVLSGLEAGTIEAREQPAEGVSFAPKITVQDAQLDWTRPAVALDRQIRACTPFPGAWTSFEGERFKIVAASVGATGGLAPGELQVTKNALYVGTGTNVLQLSLVKAFGKREMTGADWARGVRLAERARLGG